MEQADLRLVNERIPERVVGHNLNEVTYLRTEAGFNPQKL